MKRVRLHSNSTNILPTLISSVFTPGTIRRRAARAWKAAELEPVALHSARHTFASSLIAAGVNGKALTTYVGHTSITTTMDMYGHLMRGSEDEAVNLVDAYLARADTAAPPRRTRSMSWSAFASAVAGVAGGAVLTAPAWIFAAQREVRVHDLRVDEISDGSVT